MCLYGLVPILLQTCIAYCGAFFFCIAAIVSMVHVENDDHLMYLTDNEEWLHPYFYMHRLQVHFHYCKTIREFNSAICFQSVFSLFTGLWFLMHAIMTTDMLIVEPWVDFNCIFLVLNCLESAHMNFDKIREYTVNKLKVHRTVPSVRYLRFERSAA